MFQNRDTIAAQATAAGEGGVAIVRVSGADCEAVVSRVFRAKNGKPLANRVLTYGCVMENGEIADEAMAVLMRAPHSYTRENVAEIHCHGSQALVRKILMLLMAAGARMAEPGEFTYRAFMNGRIDLAQAEGVMRMIRAGSERAMRSAVRQMEGGVSAFVRTARAEITSLLAAMAAVIDFPDEVEETQTALEVTASCKAIAARLEAACDARAGRIEDEGLRVVLCGRPNAGKSSLLNALLGGERAIVTDIPGTTRDTLTEAMQIGGVRVLLTDTAGLRETGDAVERIGVERAKKALAEADVRALVLDGASPLTEEDKAALRGQGDSGHCRDRRDRHPAEKAGREEGADRAHGGRGARGLWRRADSGGLRAARRGHGSAQGGAGGICAGGWRGILGVVSGAPCGGGQVCVRGALRCGGCAFGRHAAGCRGGRSLRCARRAGRNHGRNDE